MVKKFKFGEMKILTGPSANGPQPALVLVEPEIPSHSKSAVVTGRSVMVAFDWLLSSGSLPVGIGSESGTDSPFLDLISSSKKARCSKT